MSRIKNERRRAVGTGGSPMNCEGAAPSLATIIAFTLGSTFAHLAGTGLLDRNDAADRLSLLADTVRNLALTDPTIAELTAAELRRAADAVRQAVSLN